MVVLAGVEDRGVVEVLLEDLDVAGRVRGRELVDDGDLVTSGAVTSGLDLALHLLDRTYGANVVFAVEELFAYERRGTVWTR